MRKHLHIHGPRVHVCAECGKVGKAVIYTHWPYRTMLSNFSFWNSLSPWANLHYATHLARQLLESDE